MGCWNATCVVSNLHIKHGQRVAVFMISRKPKMYSYCYNNSYYTLCSLPFYAKYNDYGGGEDCSGPGLPYILDAIRDNLDEMEQGENPYHDIQVKKEGF